MKEPTVYLACLVSLEEPYQSTYSGPTAPLWAGLGPVDLERTKVPRLHSHRRKRTEPIDLTRLVRIKCARWEAPS